jgi:hypothetical protein
MAGVAVNRLEKDVVQAAIKVYRIRLAGVVFSSKQGDEARFQLKKATEALIYGCDQCNYDRHLCPGCGANVEHGDFACADCHPPTGTSHPCFECLIDPTEDPAPWCDCRSDEECKGPCRRRAHAPEHCPNRPDGQEAFDKAYGEEMCDNCAPLLAGASADRVDGTNSEMPCGQCGDYRVWTSSTWAYVMRGDDVRLPGRPDSVTTVQEISSQEWHASVRQYTNRNGELRDWIEPHEHTEISVRLAHSPDRTIRFAPTANVEILMDNARRAAFLLQQAFPGSIRV